MQQRRLHRSDARPVGWRRRWQAEARLLQHFLPQSVIDKVTNGAALPVTMDAPSATFLFADIVGARTAAAVSLPRSCGRECVVRRQKCVTETGRMPEPTIQRGPIGADRLRIESPCSDRSVPSAVQALPLCAPS